MDCAVGGLAVQASRSCAAKALGLTFPLTLLGQTDEVI